MLVIVVLLCFVAASCAPAAVSPARREEAQRKFIEYQLAANVVSRSQTCFESLLPELRATIEGSEGTASQQKFAAKWGLKRFDPNTGFDDALAACMGEPTLKDLGIGDDETALRFLERKRSEWEQAEQAEAGGRSVSK